ncbi:MAG: DUF2059 domain-containing protein [Candidatus Korobacteraceae bacterium]
MGVLAWLGCVLCGAALAQTVTLDTTPPSRAQVLQLMRAMGVQQSVDESLRSTQAKIKAAARAAFEKKDPNADAATLKKLGEVFDSTPLFTFEDISEAIIPVYQKNLSAGDVQAGIDFYNSEAGKRLLEKVPVILREANEQGGQLVQTKLQAYSEELERKLGAFESEVNSQKPPETPQPKAADDASKTTGKTTDGTSK